MRYLLILNASLFALALTLAVVLAVVCLLYGMNADLSSQVAAELPLLITTTLTFTVLSLLLGAAFWGLLRERAWRWAGQAGAALGLTVGALYLTSLLTG